MGVHQGTVEEVLSWFYKAKFSEKKHPSPSLRWLSEARFGGDVGRFSRTGHPGSWTDCPPGAERARCVLETTRLCL